MELGWRSEDATYTPYRMFDEEINFASGYILSIMKSTLKSGATRSYTHTTPRSHARIHCPRCYHHLWRIQLYLSVDVMIVNAISFGTILVLQHNSRYLPSYVLISAIYANSVLSWVTTSVLPHQYTSHGSTDTFPICGKCEISDCGTPDFERNLPRCGGSATYP